MKKKKQVDPELKQMLTELEEVADKLGYKVRYEKGNFAGGYCVLKESRLLVVNSRNEIERRIIIVSKSLKEIGIDDIYVKPNIRELIEKESSRKLKDNEEVTENAEETE
ncbi:MAG: hypothetical protein UZ05_CHB002000116 [Chlorobi bacterium OLB5]|nr:MAG: hypothetical protein UZ05_CHB002000116 [Chlorobi bacterium OLB5]